MDRNKKNLDNLTRDIRIVVEQATTRYKTPITDVLIEAKHTFKIPFIMAGLYSAGVTVWAIIKGGLWPI